MATTDNDLLAEEMTSMGLAARRAASELAKLTNQRRNELLSHLAKTIRDAANDILAANALDMAAAHDKQLSDAKKDRLQLDDARVASIASAVEAIAKLPDTLGKVQEEIRRPNDLLIQRVTVPLGVIGIIYESRPNVTADAAALCLKSGNAVILRGGSESTHSNRAIHACIRKALGEMNIDTTAVQLVKTRSRDAVGFLLKSMAEWLDVVIPRGGKSLVARVQRDARVPVIGHLEGNCHVYVHAAADAAMAVDIVLNSKMRRTGICGAAETILIDSECAASLMSDIAAKLHAAGCAIRGDAAVCSRVPSAALADDSDWSTEYLDAIVAMRIVDGIGAAIEHIRCYGSGHTDCIVTEDRDAAKSFLDTVDSAIVLHNASTQFADGGEFGMGAEIGIATGRIHARGPVGAAQLTSYKYVVRGTGQVRQP